MKLIFASNNDHKLEEVLSVSPDWISIVPLKDSGCTGELEETTGTIRGNALQKATQVYKSTGFPCFADDSGLEVEALNGQPGVDTAHFAGPERDSFKNMNKLLNQLSESKNRKARFITVIAYVDKHGHHLFEGEVKGSISEEMQGSEGFGYDPVFIPENHSVTFAMMKPETKNSMSHRSRAMKLFIEFLNKQTRN
ncbi:MAG: RdgB/HAM1 family non-canonical purine NTP pyrophosphatase [Bacteroidetes bacterium]|nr:RdgB/HAM1 family non-canonical purine NTP pyrophosphatase [Bacteroidota bacterium]